MTTATRVAVRRGGGRDGPHWVRPGGSSPSPSHSPLAALPIYTSLVLDELQVADAKRYRSAARRLVKMRKLAAGTS